jgi:hypothetical protein
LQYECILIYVTVLGVQEGVTKILRVQHNQVHGAILDWLTKDDYTLQQKDFFSQRLQGTGQWLLNSAKYHDWLNTEEQTLFCPGIPGAGKTILTSIVIENLIATFGKDEKVGIAYIYCNYKQRNAQSAEGLLRSLIKQLAQDLPYLADCVEQLYKSQSAKQMPPLFSDFSRALQSIAAIYSRVYIIVDALDECQAEGDCRSTFLSEIFNLQAKTGAKLFATSRHIPDIEQGFKGCLTCEILASDEDVYRYLDGHMRQLPKFILRLPEVQEKIRTEITTAVEGM